jgi:peptidoglycan/xylan/chitin deacetylase (PgdA/CDA1 family)
MRVAVTLDDLPYMVMPSLPPDAAPGPPPGDVAARIIRALADHAVPAAVFVNTGLLADAEAELRPWVEAGIEIGNHTATHVGIDDVDAARWRDDVHACDAALRAVLGRAPRWFRFPFLRYGGTAERKEMGSRVLHEMGYDVAHVSAATAEWLLAHYYEIAARRRMEDAGRELGGALVEHVAAVLRGAREVAAAMMGRDVPQVLLLHVNRLTADHLPAVLGRMRDEGWAFVTLGDALADPCYALPDRYVGPGGCSWLARVGPDLRESDGGDPFTREKLKIQERFRPVFGWPEVPFVA